MSPGRQPTRIRMQNHYNYGYNDQLCKKGQFVSRVVPGKEEAAQKYKDYFEWSESLKDAPSHRVLAMRRGEKEELLYLDIEVAEEEVVPAIDTLYIKAANPAATQTQIEICDSYSGIDGTVEVSVWDSAESPDKNPYQGRFNVNLPSFVERVKPTLK
ncbi:hypothetical protein FQR65_LT14726 [Abscondita terminalis]|nr:hypothetical protein FQR65_LT14726 [Abscondita terminalis]